MALDALHCIVLQVVWLLNALNASFFGTHVYIQHTTLKLSPQRRVDTTLGLAPLLLRLSAVVGAAVVQMHARKLPAHNARLSCLESSTTTG